jgi:broad specificity phosphatase PhoE
MAVEIIFETHSLSLDNEVGIATGWNHGQLSERGRALAAEVGKRRRDVDIVFTSDLGRAAETAAIAFRDWGIPVRLDWRLRECNYGDWNGMRVEKLDAERSHHVVDPFPGGESYSDVVFRVADFLSELASGLSGRRVLIVGHTATRWALDHLLNGADLARLVASPFEWREGWRYDLSEAWQAKSPVALGERPATPIIRRARSDEAEVLFELQRSSALAGFAHIFDPVAHPFRDETERGRWMSFVTAAETSAFVAESNGDPVGVAVVSDGELVRLFVTPDRWRTGVGTVLHDAVVNFLESEGRTSVGFGS